MADVEKEAVASSSGLSAKQQKLFELRMRMVCIGWNVLGYIFVLNQLFFQNEGRKLNHMEVASEKRRAQDPIGQHVVFLIICGKQ